MKKKPRKSRDGKGILLNDKEMNEFMLNLAREVISERKNTAANLLELVGAGNIKPNDTVRNAINFLTRDITPQQYLDEVNAKLDKEEKENL